MQTWMFFCYCGKKVVLTKPEVVCIFDQQLRDSSILFVTYSVVFLNFYFV